MDNYNFKKEFLLERAVSVFSDESELSESQAEIIKQVKDFDIDEIYFSTDGNDSYPAVFLKRVKFFDTNTFSCITEIQRKMWNYKKVLFLYVYNDTEIHIYNCSEKPNPFDKNKANVNLSEIELASAQFADEKKIGRLANVFSSISLDSGQFWTLQEAQEYKNKIKLQHRVDKYLIQSLLETTKCLKNKGLENIDVIHKLLLRSLFLLYLEDRGATDATFYNSIQKGASSYFDILNNVEDTYRLFRELESHFNGNVFSIVEGEKGIVTNEHLKLIKQCFISGNDGTSQINLFPDWRIFNFKIIQIELLSEIYENFMAEANLEQKKKTGTFYTPPSLVELILNEKLPCKKQDTEYNVKVLDPACGSGIFLVESFKRLVKRYENHTKTELTDFGKLKEILLKNIYGIEINHQSIMIAAFSLYLALLDKLNPKTLWQDKKLPYLINSELIPVQKRGNNLFCRDAIQTNQEIENIHFDLVVGNPPFGTENKSKDITLSQSIRDYCEKEDFAKEMVLPFFHKATKFSSNGEIALVFNAKILTNTGPKYQNFRRWLFNKCSVSKIYNFSVLRNAPKDFGGQLFGSAIGPICIAFYKVSKENESDRIVYYAPKTYVKNNVLEGLVIDSTDVKYLPREECKKPDTKIWKIAMWGGTEDLNLINKLSKHQTLSNFVEANNLKIGLGLQFIDSTTKKPICCSNVCQTYITPNSIGRFVSFYTGKLSDSLPSKTKERCRHSTDAEKIECFRRLGNIDTYIGPHVLIKEGITKSKIYASYIEEDCSFNSKVIGISNTDEKTLKAITCLINSKLAEYYLFICAASIGIEREEIKMNDIENIPFNLSPAIINQLATLYDTHITKSEFQTDFSDLESQVDKLLFACYNLSSEEQFLIQDFALVVKPLMMKSNMDYAFAPTNKGILEPYSNTFCASINKFLSTQKIRIQYSDFYTDSQSPLSVFKVSFGSINDTFNSKNLKDVLTIIDRTLWEKNAVGIYFRKKLNYYDGDDIYLIRPNQRRFWTQSAAMADASELILEILNMN